MAKSKEELIKDYKKLRDRLGRPPSSTEFKRGTGVGSNALDKYFGSNAWSKLVKLCGDVPKEFSKEKSDLNAIFNKYGTLARELKKMPTKADWQFKGLRPTPSGILASHEIGWSELAKRFHAFALGNEEWADIIDLFRPEVNIDESISDPVREGYVYLISYGDYYKIGRSENLERRVKEVRFALPENGELVHAIKTDDPSGIEAYWHNRLKECRAPNNSEFFKLTAMQVRAFKKRKFQ